MTTLKAAVNGDDHIQGTEKALVTLVEYGDYECPHCGRAYYIIKKLQNHFGAQLRFVFRNFPLTQIHSYAEPAAETAEFASEHNKFWEMHDLIYENQEDLNETLLLELAERLKIPAKQLPEIWEQKKYAPKIKKDFMSGVRSGVNGTPTFFINGIRYDGPASFEDLVMAIEAIEANIG